MIKIIYKMRKKYGFFASVASLALGTAGFLSSCEDKCVGCQCDSFVVDHVVNADSMDVALTQLDAKTTVVIIGSGLSTANGVYLVDADNNRYSVNLNPSFVTDEALVVTLDCDANNVRTERLLVTSSGGCEKYVELAKPVPSPSIKMFYSEFVPDGDTLRIAGNAFLSVPGDELKVYFYDKNDNPIKAEYKKSHGDSELLVIVPSGVADSKPVTVENKFGKATSTMLFRDTRNIFLDFDEKVASNQHGALEPFTFDWNDYVTTSSKASVYDEMLTAIGGKMPAPCNGYYAVITSTADGWMFNQDEMIYLTPKDQGQEYVNLLGGFKDQDLENLVLKFEVLVPSQVPLGAWFYVVFSAYGAEDWKNLCPELYELGNCGFYSRDLTKVMDFNKETNSCDKVSEGVPAAWLNMTTLSVDDTKDSPSATLAKSFNTGGKWMTVAIPLKSSVFKQDVSSWGLVTNENYISCGDLKKDRDFGNFFIHCDVNNGFQAEAAPAFGGKLFCAFDNFRIVPDDNGGVRFTKYYGAIPTSAYPF